MNKRGSNGFVDAAVVVLAILLFFRTADVLTYFAPPFLNGLVGQDVSWLYAGVMAFFVEGVALAFHFDPRAHNHTPAIIVKWVLLGISALCQVFDGNIVTNRINEMSGPMRLAFEWGVPLLPIIVVVLLFFVGKLPDDSSPRPVVGLKNRLPNFNRMWNGDPVENSVFSPKVVEQLEKISESSKNPNGEKSDTANPTKAGQR